MRYFQGRSRLAAIALILLAVAPTRSALACPVSLTPSLGSQAIPDDTGCTRDLETFGHLAWQTFKMLVWPASKTMRGQPDTARGLSDMAGPRVFETYKGDWETFLKDAAPPLPWNEYPSTVAACKRAQDEPPVQISPGTLVLASLNEFGNVTEPAFGNITHVLVAQNHTLVRYLAAFDQNQFNLIVAGKLYDQANLPPQNGSAPTAATTAPDGTITIKSAWVEMNGLKTDPTEFFTRSALLQDPMTGFCKTATVGLVGLHIVQKTKSSPQWIWASFEHVKNAPPSGAAPAAGFTFNDGSGTPMPPDAPLNAQDPMKPGWVIPPPYNVERLEPIEPDIVAINTAWRSALGSSVWANYELVMVQWPGLPSDPARDGLTAMPTPPCFQSEHKNLVNTTMETFVQGHVSCTTMTTCMGCHTGARSTDFVWAMPLNAMSARAHFFPNRIAGLEFLRSITRREPK
jgi:hypothetical protein